MRRPLRSKPAEEAEAVEQPKSKRKAPKQLTLDLPELTFQGVQYEYVVLVTSLTDEVRPIAQHYRDRGDAENNFDELKNQWGWAGFTTKDRKRCQIMGRIIALIYNWWTIFMRLGIPDKHAEAITSRPLALHGIARQTRHGNQTTVEITSTHAKASQIAAILTKVSGFLKAHLKPAPSSRDLEQRVSLAEGSIGAALRVGDEAGKAQQAAQQWLEAVLAGPGSSFERALKQGTWGARGEFTAMLDALAETLGEAARGTLGQPVRRTVPQALLRYRDPDPLLKAMEHVADAREAAWGNVNPQVLLAVLGEELAEVL